MLFVANAGHPSILVLLGLSAAFDRFDHTILLSHIKQYVGFSGVALEKFKFCLVLSVLLLLPLGVMPPDCIVGFLRVQFLARLCSPFTCCCWTSRKIAHRLPVSCRRCPDFS